MIIEGKTGLYRKKIQNLFEVAGDVLGEDFSYVCVSVNFVDEQEIQTLNQKHRGIDKVTDVLSFPNLQKTPVQKLTDFENEKIDEQLFLGDIVICVKKAKLQAKEYGHSKNREICFLALHGLLHLLGFDHMTESDEKVMSETAEKILTKFGVQR